LVLYANDNVGQKILNYLLENFRDDLHLVVCVEQNEIYRCAMDAGINAITSDAVDYANLNADLAILSWWPKILKDQQLKQAKHGIINFHPSLLPYNRGKHYNFWALVEESPFGVSLHFIDSGIDTGDVIAQRKINYDWTDTGESLYRKAQEEIIDLFKEKYPLIRKLNITRNKQDLSSGSFHNSSEMDIKSRIELDGSYTGRELLNILRARTFKGHPGCRFTDNGVLYEATINIRRIDEPNSKVSK
jgi:methionyl-tRNA formyltransferase